MKLIVQTCEQNAALVEEYKLALRRLADARADHPWDSQAKEVVEATRVVELLEEQLKNHRLTHGC